MTFQQFGLKSIPQAKLYYEKSFRKCTTYNDDVYNNNNNSNLNIQGMLLQLLWQKIKIEKEITISNCTHYNIFLSQQKLKILFKSQLLSLSAAQEILYYKCLKSA